VDARLTGIVSNVTVTQEFGNPYPEPIEAVYGLPQPENATGPSRAVVTLTPGGTAHGRTAITGLNPVGNLAYSCACPAGFAGFSSTIASGDRR